MSVVHGVVRDFDEHRGDGTLETTTGESLYFHCVNIADGSRRIPVGATVVAQRCVGLRGRDEARAVYSVEATRT